MVSTPRSPSCCAMLILAVMFMYCSLFAVNMIRFPRFRSRSLNTILVSASLSLMAKGSMEPLKKASSSSPVASLRITFSLTPK